MGLSFSNFGLKRIDILPSEVTNCQLETFKSLGDVNIFIQKNSGTNETIFETVDQLYEDKRRDPRCKIAQWFISEVSSDVPISINERVAKKTYQDSRTDPLGPLMFNTKSYVLGY